MRANEFINELFQPGKKNWEWMYRGSQEAVAEFTVGNREYRWQAFNSSANPLKWEIQFRLIRKDTDPEELDLFGKTGTGNSTEVLSIAVDITRAFLQEYGLERIEELTFNAKEDSRVGLYAKMIKRLLPDWDLRSKPDILNGGMIFYLTDRRAYDKPENKLNETDVDEMALKQYTPMGDFEKPGPFRGVDKKLIPHPTSQLKTQKFFEKTPYDFRLFFSNIPGTGRYGEYGVMDPKVIQEVFGNQAQQIIDGSEDSITVVFVGNKGDSKVMMTPWVMAHRIGHAVQASSYNTARSGDTKPKGPWREAETHFFKGINELLNDYYGKKVVNQFDTQVNWKLRDEYSALFNAIGTQRSSRKKLIKRPYEFFYEMFAQYLGTGTITLNRLPNRVDYGRKAWGRSTQSLRLDTEAEKDTQYTTEVLAHDMEIMFSAVLSSMVGKIYIM